MERRHIKFGLAATAIALLAKQGICRNADRLELSTTALRLVADNPPAIAAVLNFIDRSMCAPAPAGDDLHQFIREWQGDLRGMPHTVAQKDLDLVSPT